MHKEKRSISHQNQLRIEIYKSRLFLAFEMKPIISYLRGAENASMYLRLPFQLSPRAANYHLEIIWSKAPALLYVGMGDEGKEKRVLYWLSFLCLSCKNNPAKISLSSAHMWAPEWRHFIKTSCLQEVAAWAPVDFCMYWYALRRIRWLWQKSKS